MKAGDLVKIIGIEDTKQRYGVNPDMYGVGNSVHRITRVEGDIIYILGINRTNTYIYNIKDLELFNPNQKEEDNMKKEVNKYIDNAIQALTEFKPESFSDMLRIQIQLKENAEMFQLAGRITSELLPEYLDLVPATKTAVEEYETYLEVLRQEMLDNW